jgi:hypothetical protein
MAANPATPGRWVGRVTTPYAAQYAEPIAARAGEALIVTDRVDHWDGRQDWVWVWCTDPRGKSGRVPAALIEGEGAHAHARRDYSAAELFVAAGAEIAVEREESGWLWCIDAGGNAGWVPSANVARITSA